MRDTYYDDFDCWLYLLKNNVKAIGIDEVQIKYIDTSKVQYPETN